MIYRPHCRRCPHSDIDGECSQGVEYKEDGSCFMKAELYAQIRLDEQNCCDDCEEEWDDRTEQIKLDAQEYEGDDDYEDEDQEDGEDD